jgi:hypothetical protein
VLRALPNDFCRFILIHMSANFRPVPPQLTPFKKGHPKLGGRTKGTPNRSTAKRLSRQAFIVEQIKELLANPEHLFGPTSNMRRRMGVETLQELLTLFMALAMHYMPELEGEPNPTDRELFIEYSEIVRNIARDLAPYESPKLKPTEVQRETPKKADKGVRSDNEGKPAQEHHPRESIEDVRAFFRSRGLDPDAIEAMILDEVKPKPIRREPDSGH